MSPTLFGSPELPFLGCITLQQPYASAIFDADGLAGPKDVENRPRAFMKIPEGGALIGIHAGATIYKALRKPLGGGCAFDAWDLAVDDFYGLWPSCPDLDKLPRGEILGIAHILPAVRFEPPFLGSDRKPLRSPWAFGPVCYPVPNRRKLATPIAGVVGALGLWDPARPRHAVAAEDIRRMHEIAAQMRNETEGVTE